MKRLLIVVAVLALLALTISSVAAFEPNNEVVPDGPEIVPDAPDIAWGGPTLMTSGCPDPYNCTPPLSAVAAKRAVTVSDVIIEPPTLPAVQKVREA